MFNILIIDTSARKEFINIITLMKQELRNKKLKVTIKATDNTQITDLTISDLIIIGVGDHEKAAIHPDFTEISRALTGINLAGRLVAFFTINSSAAIQKYQKMFRDSDITIYKKFLIINNEKIENQIAIWISDLLKNLKENFNE